MTGLFKIGSATKSMNGSPKPLLRTNYEFPTKSDPLGISSMKRHQHEIKNTDMLDRFSCWREKFNKHVFFFSRGYGACRKTSRDDTGE